MARTAIAIPIVDGPPVKLAVEETFPGSGIYRLDQSGAQYVASAVALSAGQASGANTILAANDARKALMINPPSDCFLAISANATSGWPLFGGVPNTFSGPEVPMNALYIVGLSAADVVTIWEA